MQYIVLRRGGNIDGKTLLTYRKDVTNNRSEILDQSTIALLIFSGYFN